VTATLRLQQVHSIIVFACLIGLASSAIAQDQRRGGFGFAMFGRSSFLIDMPEVLVELGVADEQKELLDALDADLSDQRRVIFLDGGHQLRSRIEAFERRGEQLVTVVLEPDQANRLTELRLQREGARALRRPDVLDKLELSEAQRKEIDSVFKASESQQIESVFDLNQIRQQLEKQEADILAVMTDEQKARWEELKGKPFQFPRRNRFGRRPRRP